MKIITIEEGPHFRVQMDIWYINEDIAKICGYNYMLDIIDVFSKFIFSYVLINKTADEVLIALRKYILSFGKFKKLQIDNGLEFRNTIIKNFCIENDIERIFSPPYQPQANGAVEDVHKTIQKFINDYFYTSDGKNFSIEKAILDAIEYHNFTKHSSTKYIPWDLKDTTDIKLIEEVKNNIKNTVG